MESFTFEIRGEKPKAYSTYEHEWKRRLTATARGAVASEGATLPVEEGPVRIDAVFFLMEAVYWRTDIDNLAKPLLDVLFKSSTRRTEAESGALFPFDDRFVTHLSLEKRVAVTEQAQGCDVRVEWEA